MRASGVFNKNRFHKYTIIGIEQLQKKERDHFEQRSAHQTKKSVQLVGLVRTTAGCFS